MIHPRLSIVLFAYKQEHCIREAVLGLLSQECSSLEIVLSDDCSPDRTYEIMKECAEEYKGPHTVVLNRNSANMGVSAHVKKVYGIARGEWLVCADGDDVSLPCRCAETIKAIEKFPEAVAISSEYLEMDEGGHCDGETGEDEKETIYTWHGEDRITDLVRKNNWNFLTGCSVALSRKLIEAYPLFDGIWAGDFYYSHVALLMGGSVKIHKPLVKYRQAAVSLSSLETDHTSKKSILRKMRFYAQMDRKDALIMKHLVRLIDLCLVGKSPTVLSKEDLVLFRDYCSCMRRVYRIRGVWWHLALCNKLRFYTDLVGPHHSVLSLKSLYKLLPEAKFVDKACKYFREKGKPYHLRH